MSCDKNERILMLEKKVEYLERVVQALADYKKDKVIEVSEIDNKWRKIASWTRNAFEEEMKKIWSYTLYWWEETKS